MGVILFLDLNIALLDIGVRVYLIAVMAHEVPTLWYFVGAILSYSTEQRVMSFFS